MKNTTSVIHPLQPYQQALLDRVSQGFKHGEMAIFSSGRQTGKSMLTMLKTRYYSANLCKEIMLPTSPVKQEKYRFSRAKWYTAELHGNSTWIFSDEYNNIIAWCTEQFGAHPTKQDAWSRWWVGLGEINFRDEKDFVLYQLRWA